MLSLVLGLGNTGERYQASRHNLGFRVVEKLIEKYRLKLQLGTDQFDWAEKITGSGKIILAMPKTYMNRSGIVARALLQQYDLDLNRLIVLVDDFNLRLGQIRIRGSGSDGGHKGLASIVQEVGTQDFPRLRMGIGPRPENTGKTEFVLGDFEPHEKETVEEMIATASEAVVHYIEHGLEEAMSLYNRDPA
ncbi:MAG: aminoacyl-tRNA hydrolase [Candidatus Zixiibacteriota bacterium]|nr:MAG: aminoacyl-tRNA hydrolase [candidate division Zixibacteria bacterium]